jgi:hypothetical protein
LKKDDTQRAELVSVLNRKDDAKKSRMKYDNSDLSHISSPKLKKEKPKKIFGIPKIHQGSRDTLDIPHTFSKT